MKTRDYMRSRDGERWNRITFLRFKEEAWKHAPSHALIYIEHVRRGGTILFGSYLYRKVMTKQEAAQ